MTPTTPKEFEGIRLLRAWNEDPLIANQLAFFRWARANIPGVTPNELFKGFDDLRRMGLTGRSEALLLTMLRHDFASEQRAGLVVVAVVGVIVAVHWALLVWVIAWFLR